MKTRKIKIKGKIVEAVECKSALSKLRGLMFKNSNLPLLLVFNRPTRQSIHSFFCRPFYAVWMRNGRVIDEKTVRPFSFSIKPKGEFTEVLEIPLRNNNNAF